MNSVLLDVVAQRQNVGEPWLYRLGQEFGVTINIRRANIDADSGYAEVELVGPLEEIQRATTWLMTTGLHVEARERSLGTAGSSAFPGVAPSRP